MKWSPFRARGPRGLNCADIPVYKMLAHMARNLREVHFQQDGCAAVTTAEEVVVIREAGDRMEPETNHITLHRER